MFDVGDLPDFQLPSAETAVNAFSKVYQDVLQPFYRHVRTTLEEDIECIVETLHDARPDHATSSGWDDSFETLAVSQFPPR